jgi:hypothetical protein
MLSRIVRGGGRRAITLLRGPGKDPAAGVVSEQFVRSSYRVLLHREAASEEAMANSMAARIARIASKRKSHETVRYGRPFGRDVCVVSGFRC